MYWLIITAVGLATVALTIYAIKHWPGNQYLCDNCRFNDPKSCFKPERPKALICLAYKAKQEKQ